jgi:hypothetical protein
MSSILAIHRGFPKGPAPATLPWSRINALTVGLNSGVFELLSHLWSFFPIYAETGRI